MREMTIETRELREKTTGELEDELHNLKKLVLDIRVKMPTQEGANPYLLRTHRRRIARIRTILHERACAPAAPDGAAGSPGGE